MPNTDEAQALRKAVRLINIYRSGIDRLVPSQVMAAFTIVAEKEGLTLSELADALGTNLSTASRQMLDLGERNRKMEPGYNLIERRPDPMNLRVMRHVLSPKGRLLKNQIIDLMKE